MHWADRIGRRLKLRDLHILLAVVRCGSMARAADELAISQPAVSKAVADMERVLGLRLLDRSRNGVEPTAYGRALVGRGVAIFDELKHGVEELAFLSDPAAGEIRIGSTESVAAGLLPAVIERFSLEYPRVRLDVAQAVISTLHFRELRDRSIHLLIGRIPCPFEENDLEADIVYDDQVVVVAGRNSKWTRARNLKLADLMGAPWVLPPPGTLAGDLTAQLFDGGMPSAPVSTLSIHLCCKMAATGRFLSFLPASILRFAAPELPLMALPVKLPTQNRPVAIVTLKNRTLSPVTKQFIACVHRIAKGG